MEELQPAFIPYLGASFSLEESELRAENYAAELQKRRSVRDFSNREVPQSLIENLIKAAAAAPLAPTASLILSVPLQVPKSKKRSVKRQKKRNLSITTAVWTPSGLMI